MKTNKIKTKNSKKVKRKKVNKMKSNKKNVIIISNILIQINKYNLMHL